MKYQSRNIFHNLILLTICFQTISCSSIDKDITDVNEKIELFNQDIKETKNIQFDKLKHVQIIDGFYAPPLSSDVLTKPDWWLTSVPLLNSQNITLQDLMNQLVKEFDINYRFSDVKFNTLPISVNFTGTLGDLVQQIAAQLNLYFELNDQVIIWQEFETQVFNIRFIPGSYHYSFGNQNITAPSTEILLNDTTSQNSDASSEEANFKVRSNIWEELNNVMHNLLAGQGSFTVSESSSTLTVQTKPDKLTTISNYVKKLNAKLAQQIYIDVQVIEVRMDDGMNYGINWNIVKQSMSNGGILGFTTQVSQSGFDSIPPVTFGAAITDSTSQYFNSSLLINALEKQGQVSVVTSPRIVTLNNQMAEIAITEKNTYLAESSSRTTANVGAETTLKPGVVETGLQLYVLPLVVGDEILLQIHGNISTLQGITTVESNNSLIQTPNVLNKRIMQKAKVRLGKTLMLAGFKNSRNQTKNSGLFGQAWLSGNKSYNQQTTEMIILLSPYILGGNHAP